MVARASTSYEDGFNHIAIHPEVLGRRAPRYWYLQVANIVETGDARIGWWWDTNRIRTHHPRATSWPWQVAVLILQDSYTAASACDDASDTEISAPIGLAKISFTGPSRVFSLLFATIATTNSRNTMRLIYSSLYAFNIFLFSSPTLLWLDGIIYLGAAWFSIIA